MTKLVVSSASGWGNCTDKNSTTFTVVRADRLYNLMVQRKGEFSFWEKENAKRISTLQRYADERGYDIKIELI